MVLSSLFVIKRKDNSLKVDENTKNRQKKLELNGKEHSEKEDMCWGKHENFKHDCMRGNNSE